MREALKNDISKQLSMLRYALRTRKFKMVRWIIKKCWKGLTTKTCSKCLRFKGRSCSTLCNPCQVNNLMRVIFEESDVESTNS